MDSVICYAQRTLSEVRETELKKYEKDPKWASGRRHYVYAPTEQEVADRLRTAAPKPEGADE